MQGDTDVHSAAIPPPKNRASKPKFRGSAPRAALLTMSMLHMWACSATADSLQALSVSHTPYLTAEDAIMLSYARSPVLSKAFSQIKKSEAQTRETQSAYYPQVSLTSNYGQHGEYVYGAKLKQLIYDFGKTASYVESQSYLTAAYRDDLMKIISEVTGDTLLAYSSIQRYQETIGVTQRMIASLEDVKRIAELRLSAGLSSSSDALQASSRIAGLKTTLEQYRSQLQNAQASFAQLTGKQAETLAPLPAILQQDLTQNPNQPDYASVPAVQSAVAQVKASQAALAATKAQHMPSISFDASRLNRYQRTLNNSNPGWDNQFGVSVDVPLYQGGAISSRVLQAHEALTSSQAGANQAWLDAEQRTSTALSNWHGANARVQSSLYQIQVANRTRNIYQEEYKLGDRSLNDLLGVEQDVFQALNNSTAAKFDRYDAVIVYSVIQNTLLSLLGVASPGAQPLPDL